MFAQNYCHMATEYCASSSLGISNTVVSVENVCKSNGERKQILSNVCMNVNQGSIYGLLGSSGSSKTTLLNCILGLRSWDSGSISLFGKSVTGLQATRNVGYMPQEIALHNEISIKETVQYYGRLYGLRNDEIERQWNWITELLHLPATFKLIKDCSGGMKRRVSLAVTLFYIPKLLVLDEPTVGLDPMLRESIWNYLYDIANTGKATIILTTHYIEEARNSTKIGFMRDGKLLVEGCPDLLLARYNCTLLEECMLKICRGDKPVRNIDSVEHNNIISNANEKTLNNIARSKSLDHYNIDMGDNASSSVYERIRALSTVIWLLYFRHPLFIFIILLLPTTQVVVTLLVIGTNPKGIQFGVVNHETPDYNTCFSAYTNTSNSEHLQYYSDTGASCDFQFVSCSVIKHLSLYKTMALMAIESEELAKSKVAAGELWGYISVPSNYSAYFSDLILTKQFADNETFTGSTIPVTMDMSHFLITKFAILDIYNGFLNFTHGMAASCGLDPREFQPPLNFRKPVFGTDDFLCTEYVIPIIILTVAVVMETPMLLTSLLYVSEVKQGTLDRSRLASLKFKEIMLSHLITQGSLLIVQVAIFSLIIHVFWGLYIKGSFWLYFILCVFSGLGGEVTGLLLGVFTENEANSLLIGIWWGIFCMTYSGLLEPLRGLRGWVKHVAYNLPVSTLCEPLRSMMYRGFGMFHEMVWPGILKYCLWCLILGIISIVGFIRIQKRK